MLRLSLVIGCLLASSACYTYRPAATPVPRGALVRLRFDPPRPIVIVARDGDTLRVDGITLLEGRVLNARGDTLDLELAAARSGPSTQPSVQGSRTTVVPERGRPAEVRQVSRGTRAGALVAGTAGAVAVSLLVLILVYALTIPGPG
jgi:hypothetical protein